MDKNEINENTNIINNKKNGDNININYPNNIQKNQLNQIK